MSNPVPLDQAIVDEVQRLLQLITPENGYLTNAGSNVLTEETPGALPDNAIVLEILDETDALTKQAQRYREGTLALTVDVLVPRKLGAPRALARKVLWDIRRALSVPARQLPTGMTGMEIGSRTIPPRVEGSQYVTAQINVSVAFTETQPVPV